MRKLNILKVFLTSVLLITSSACAIPAIAGRFMSFSSFSRSLVKQHLEDDYMTMHYLMENPEGAGFIEPSPALNWHTLSAISYRDETKYCESVLKKLQNYDYARLPEPQKREYETIKEYFEARQELNQYPEYDYQWYPVTGTFDKTVTNLSEFPIRNENDISAFFSCLMSAPTYFDSMMKLTDWQIEHGCFPETSTVRESSSRIRSYWQTDLDDLSMTILFREKLDVLDLKPDKKEKYIEKYRSILETAYMPAVKKCFEYLDEKVNTEDPPTGSGSSRRDYYQAYIRTLIGSRDDLDDIRFALDRDIRSAVKEMNSISEEAKTEDIELSESTAIIEHLQNSMSDYPKTEEIRYEVTETGKTSRSTLAYYVVSELDSHSKNLIRVNDIPGSSNIMKYIVLAHEAFPGHCYQKNYYKFEEQPSYIPMVFYNPAFTEGWAQYVELDMLKHSGLSEEAVRYWTLKETIEYELSAFADITINGLGWTWEELDAYIKDIGYRESDTKIILAKKLASSVKQSPGLFVPYGYGMLKFRTLRSIYEQKEGSEFDPAEYHRVILQYGSRPFSTLEKDLLAVYAE